MYISCDFTQYPPRLNSLKNPRQSHYLYNPKFVVIRETIWKFIFTCLYFREVDKVFFIIVCYALYFNIYIYGDYNVANRLLV